MRVQDAVLEYLENHRQEPVSGEKLAEELAVSRNAVWKAVKKLEEEGHRITVQPKKGYRLAEDSDVISVQSVAKMLKTDFPVSLDVRREVTSTNTILKEKAEQGAPEGTVVIAESQTAGKGRLGRTFHSPIGSGIYFSILLRPTCTAEQSLYITTSAAVAVCRAIADVAGQQAAIKWVNDVYLHDKKVCGILTEAAIDFENGRLSYAVLGIGINVAEPQGGFPEEIRSIAGAVFDGPCPVEMRSRLAASVLDHFFALYRSMTAGSFMEEYRRRSFLTGKEIDFTLGNQVFHGVVTGISEEAHLLVRLDSGEVRAFSAGEVQIHKSFLDKKGST